MKKGIKVTVVLFIIFLFFSNPLSALSMGKNQSNFKQSYFKEALDSKNVAEFKKGNDRIFHPLTTKTVSFAKAVLVVHGFQWKPYRLWRVTGDMAAWLAGYSKPEDIGNQKRLLVPKGDETPISHKFFHVVPNLNTPDACDVYVSNYPEGNLGPTGDNLLPPTIGKSISEYAQKLPEEINYIKSKGNMKVDIVAHSMGGLVARRYIESRDFSNLSQSDPDYSEDYYQGDVDELIMLGTPNHGLFMALVGTYAFASYLIDTLWLSWWSFGFRFLGLFWGPFLDQFRLLKPVNGMAIGNHFLNTLNSGISGCDVGVDYYTIAGNLPIYFGSKDRIVSHFPWDGVVLSNEVKLREARGNIDVYYAKHGGLMHTKGISDFVKQLIYDDPFLGNDVITVPYNPSSTHKRFLLEKMLGWPGVLMLTIHCPLNVTIKDQYGRVIDNHGHNEIPNAEVQVIDDEKNFCLPGDLSYTIELNAYSAGTFTMESAYLGKGNEVLASVFKDVNIDTNTRLISSTIEPGNVDFTLGVDYDGDGTIDYHIKPDVKGSMCSDSLPPIKLTSELNQSHVVLQWTSAIPDTFYIAGYNVYRGNLNGTKHPVVIATVNAGTTMYTDTNIKIGERYYYYVVAFDNQTPLNYSEASNEVIVDTSKFTYTITASAGPGGSISPSGSVTVNYGADQTFTIIPNTGYMINKIIVDGVPLKFIHTFKEMYAFTNVTSNHTITATFIKKPTPVFLVEAEVSVYGGYATVTPKEQTVKSGMPASVKIIPDTGYHIIRFTDNDENISLSKLKANPDGSYTYTISAVYNSHKILVTLEKNKYTITVKTNKGGTVSPSGTVTVKYNDNVKFTVTPDTGYRIKSITIDGKPVELKNNIFRLLNVKANHTIIVTFTKVAVNSPSQSETIITLQINSPFIIINGVKKKIDEKNSEPVIKNNRTLLPIRALIESLDGSIQWNAKIRKVTINLNGNTIILTIGKNVALVNGIKTRIDPNNPDVVPIIINGRTYLPLRFIAEHLGASVDWDAATQTITIYYWP